MHVEKIIETVLVSLLVAATSDPAAGRPINAALPHQKRVAVFQAIVRESRRHDLDPVLVAAVAWAESDYRPSLVSGSADYCYLQVHWYSGGLDEQRGETWLVGVHDPDDLLDVDACARAGVAELAFWRAKCRTSRVTWWQCYKWGYRVPRDDRYARRVSERVRWLVARSRRVLRVYGSGAVWRPS